MNHELHTEIDIRATPETVWGILIDLDRYGEWNPFITSATGRPEVGQRLTNRLEPPGGRAMTFKPVVTALEHSETLEWLGRLGVPGAFDGRHRFELQPTGTGTRFTQSEKFSGLLVRLLRSSLDEHTRAGFEAMNQALKTRAESLPAD